MIASLTKQGVSRWTLFRVKTDAGVVSRPEKPGRRTVWLLAEPAAESPPEAIPPGQTQR